MAHPPRRAAALAAVLAFTLAAPAPAQPERAPDPAMRQNLDLARALSEAFERAAALIEPSVVHITTYDAVLVRRGIMSPAERVLRSGGLGSGVVITETGHILTNNHVIDTADRLMVRLADGRESEASVVGRAPEADLAVLKIDAEDLTPARFATAEPRVGEWVLAAGSPFGLTNSVSAGIVSAVGRTGLVRPRSAADLPYEDFIQTDAAVNPGNSGGPLINLHGEVVGVNTAIFTRSGGSNGISFAIPSRIAQRVVDDLISKGAVTRGWLGVTFRSASPDERAGPGAPNAQGGVVITSVREGWPAQRSGLREGDVLIEFDGRAVDSEQRFRTLVGLAQPGVAAPAVVLREGRRVELEIIVGAFLDELAREAGGVAVPRLGLVLRELEPDTRARVRRELGLDEEPRAVVLYVDNDRPGAERFQTEDLILTVDGRHLADVASIARRLNEDSAEVVELVRFTRGGAMRGPVRLRD